MLKFGFTLSVNIINTVINDPILVRLWGDIDARHKTDAINDALFRTAPLTANRFNRFTLLFRDNLVIKEEVSIFIKRNIVSHRCPEIPGGDTVCIQQTIELIMTVGVAMIGKICLRKVLKTCYQKMAIIQ